VQLWVRVRRFRCRNQEDAKTFLCAASKRGRQETGARTDNTRLSTGALIALSRCGAPARCGGFADGRRRGRRWSVPRGHRKEWAHDFAAAQCMAVLISRFCGARLPPLYLPR